VPVPVAGPAVLGEAVPEGQQEVARQLRPQGMAGSSLANVSTLSVASYASMVRHAKALTNIRNERRDRLVVAAPCGHAFDAVVAYNWAAGAGFLSPLNLPHWPCTLSAPTAAGPWRPAQGGCSPPAAAGQLSCNQRSRHEPLRSGADRRTAVRTCT